MNINVLLKKLVLVAAICCFCVPVQGMQNTTYQKTKKFLYKNAGNLVLGTIFLAEIGTLGYIYYQDGVLKELNKNLSFAPLIPRSLVGEMPVTYEQKLRYACAKQDIELALETLQEQYDNDTITFVREYPKCLKFLLYDIFVKGLPLGCEEKLRYFFASNNTKAVCKLITTQYPDVKIPMECEGMQIWQLVEWILGKSNNSGLVRSVCKSCKRYDSYVFECDFILQALSTYTIDIVTAVLDRNIEFNAFYKGLIYSYATHHGVNSHDNKNQYNPAIVTLVLNRGLYSDTPFMKTCYECCLDADLKKLMGYCIDAEELKIVVTTKFQDLCLARLKDKKAVDLHWSCV